MKEDEIKSYKEVVLSKLREAGVRGLSRGKLDIGSGDGLKDKALKELEKERKIANIGLPNKPVFVLKEFYTPLELACEIILKKTAVELTVFSKTALIKLKELPVGKIRSHAGKALDWLVKEKTLLRLKNGGKVLYANAASLRAALAAETPSLDRKRVLEAYHRVKERCGLSDIDIADLRQELSVSQELLEKFLLDDKQPVKVELSQGDWPTSSEKIRSGAIYISGKPYLLVRLIERGLHDV
ncbi:MAG: hypothetical protein HQL06_14165 [Nitrospirae bacterium]|nr:hypothetical protein [Nitrospirota bacterium]